MEYVNLDIEAFKLKENHTEIQCIIRVEKVSRVIKIIQIDQKLEKTVEDVVSGWPTVSRQKSVKRRDDFLKGKNRHPCHLRTDKLLSKIGKKKFLVHRTNQDWTLENFQKNIIITSKGEKCKYVEFGKV